MALALTHGSVGVFDRAEEDWETANKITEAAERRDVFLSVCGPKTYRVLRDLVAPKKPSYADVVAHLKTHFDPNKEWLSSGTNSTLDLENKENQSQSTSRNFDIWQSTASSVSR